ATLAILTQAKEWKLPSASFENCSQEIRAAQKRIAAQPEPQLTKLNTKPESTPRNAPCPCGSGHKFKRCCGRNAPPALNTQAA
ncbi:MAG: SEC-C metal-binding domain-containing protein, partial [Bryobacteraceae bacterium]